MIYPSYITKFPNPYNKKNETIYMFYYNSFEYKDLFEKKNLIQHQFDGLYFKGLKDYGSNKVLINMSKEPVGKYKPIYWNNKYMKKNSGAPKIVIGVDTFCKPVIWDLGRINSAKIGGATGSGKTYLQKLILIQSLYLGMEVFIYDGKKVDYESDWKNINNCYVVNKFKGFCSMIKIIYEIHNFRLKKIKYPFDTIDKYNRFHDGIPMKHIMVVIEEAVDVFGLNTKNMSKEEKKEYDDIIYMLEQLARKSRATGIHICLNSQRLSADVVPPQINSNLKFKLCGTADDILSRVMIENTDAHDLLPDDSQGLFVDGNHNIIQAYYMNNEQELLEPLKKENNKKIDCDSFFIKQVAEKESTNQDYYLFKD